MLLSVAAVKICPFELKTVSVRTYDWNVQSWRCLDGYASFAMGRRCWQVETNIEGMVSFAVMMMMMMMMSCLALNVRTRTQRLIGLPWPTTKKVCWSFQQLFNHFQYSFLGHQHVEDRFVEDIYQGTITYPTEVSNQVFHRQVHNFRAGKVGRHVQRCVWEDWNKNGIDMAGIPTGHTLKQESCWRCWFLFHEGWSLGLIDGSMMFYVHIGGE